VGGDGMSTNSDSRAAVSQILSSISLDAIVRGFTDYVDTFKMILRERWGFAQKYIVDDTRFDLRHSIQIYLYGVALTFIFYVPIIMTHGLRIEKSEFLLQFLYVQAINIFLVHISVRLFGGQGSICQSASIYCIWIGFASPIFLIFNYPVLYHAPVDDFLNAREPIVILKHVPMWAMYWSTLVIVLLFAVSAVVYTRWLADIHRIGTWRLIASLFVFFALLAFHNMLILPFVSIPIEYAAAFIDAII
jgi:hypothetical protein